MSLNPETFNLVGYLSIILWVAVILLSLIYWKKASLYLALIILVMAVLGFVGARVNSKYHVNLIQLDRSDEIAKRKAMEQARQNALLESRGDEVAQVRFAEDSSLDFLDKAGMEDADLKYFESLGIDVPEWKVQKKQRSGTNQGDGSIESAIGGEEVIEGVEVEHFEEKVDETAIVMSEQDMVMADRIDLLNLRITFMALIWGLILWILDYLRRANIDGESSYPFPFPSSWLNAITPLPPMIFLERDGRRSAEKEIERIVKRGDSFLYLTDSIARTDSLPESIAKIPCTGWKEDLIHASEAVGDEFIFETLWYGRSSFFVSSKNKARQTLDFFIEALTKRYTAQAKVKQTVHIIWDLSNPMPEPTKNKLELLSKGTGISVLYFEEKKILNIENEANKDPINSPILT